VDREGRQSVRMSEWRHRACTYVLKGKTVNLSELRRKMENFTELRGIFLSREERQ
jgi:hypothetical protein